jgi:PAS domain S-box-containing protein
MSFGKQPTPSRDIDEAVQEIDRSESGLRKAIDTIPALAWRALPDGSNDFLNKHWPDYTGLSPAESQGWGWKVAIHPADVGGLLQKLQAILASGKPGESEARLRGHDGVFRWFLFRAEPLREEAGQIVHWYATATDTDDRKRAESLLAAEHKGTHAAEP